MPAAAGPGPESSTKRCHWARGLGSLSKVETSAGLLGTLEPRWSYSCGGDRTRGQKGEEKPCFSLPPNPDSAARVSQPGSGCNRNKASRGHRRDPGQSRAEQVGWLSGQTGPGPAQNSLTVVHVFQKKRKRDLSPKHCWHKTSPALVSSGRQGSWATRP